MGVRSGSKEMSEKSAHAGHEHRSDNVSLVTSLMKSWRISSLPSSLNSSPSSKKDFTSPKQLSHSPNIKKKQDSVFTRDRKHRTSDGNFEAMPKPHANMIRTPSSNYSPLRYMSPSAVTNTESSRSPFLRNGNHNHSPAVTPLSRSNSNATINGMPKSLHDASNSKRSDRYFKDLDEDWSAVIDDYNMPIPTILNGGTDSPNSLSRKSTASSVATTSNSIMTSASFHYPQLPHLRRSQSFDLKSEDELNTERNIQELNSAIQRIAKFDSILQNKHIINLQELRQISWNGIPRTHRPIVWKLLIGYLPANTKRQQNFLARKRKEYKDGLDHTFSNHHSRDIPTWHQIEIDIPRTNPQIPLYQFKSVQSSLQRILYLWAIRHPTSGYVQGINDLVTPFYQTFLTQYLPESQIDDVTILDPETYLLPDQTYDLEADTFWCLTKLLEQITDNYIHGQPGILKQVKNLSQLVKRIDINLYTHFQKEHVEFIQFAFRWMNCLLMREFQMPTVIRMWDTYLSETSQEITTTSITIANNSSTRTTESTTTAGTLRPLTPKEQSTATFRTPNEETYRSPSNMTISSNSSSTGDESSRIRQSSFNEFHVFVCAAFLIKWSEQLIDMDFQEIITFLQNPPTKDWTETDIEMLLGEAYIWQSLYKDATSHWL
ncbi:GTPase-activating protein GYP1 NDAI_0F00480 [Naumovozyma dairenensis CBS 421]|uniref:Rab-GAP TBC domain-containing protein n=1 Tax=Naumovozyma dairenensis (strain ATCC 10597 / BCRC 20456 / CBS 421 / NBRC 0211 / NRRL Y-12639) TaxID=1071378 RepID=G0WC56_NAUDC|nr:hypothetical protein NDAI_0F00480 [Naumovozyma dairenensis CBS 421]CCD25367.1 hypothetical protein NDAI_0F00480 [Naumovozyma dairenensis CBS 421]